MSELDEQISKTHAAPKPAVNAPGTTPLPKPGPTRESELRVDVARLALLNAQHWFDEGVAAIERKKPIEWQTIVKMARVHLTEAKAELTRDDVQSASARRIVGQLDETRRAMDAYSDRMAPVLAKDAVESSQFSTVVKSVRDLDQQVRWALDLDPQPKPGAHTPANKKNDVYEAQALGTTLDLIKVETEAALEQVRASQSSKTYGPVILKATASLHQHLQYAVFVIGAHEGKDEAKIFAPKVQAASVAVAALQRWILGRENNSKMIAAFAPIEKHANELRAAVHLGTLGAIEVGVSNDQQRQNTTEQAGITAASKRLTNALRTYQSDTKLGADKFFELAKLEDPPVPGSKWTELATGFLIALLGNVVGPSIGGLIAKLASPSTANGVAQEVLKDGTKSTINGTSTATTRAWAGTVKTAMGTAAADGNQKIRDALLFRETLVKGTLASIELLEDGVTDRIKEGSISAGEIYAMAMQVSRLTVHALDRTYHEAARDFALFLAHRGTNTKASKDEKGVTEIGTAQEYFYGTDMQNGGKRDHANGIARMSANVDASGHTIRKFALAGMNKDMARAVLDAASRRVNKLGLPTEIEFSVAWSRLKPIIVVDETGKVRTSVEWDGFRASYPAVQHMADLYATPEKAWERLRGDIIPDGVENGR
jgi:hypothetical protein